MTDLMIHLRDLDQDICDAWAHEFSGLPNVDIHCADIFGTCANAIVSPANSFGFMDGGIDLVYSHRFGWDLQKRLQAKIKTEWAGELPIGSAIIIETDDPAIPWLVSAPTMRVPENVSNTVNAYLAFRATLRAIEFHNASGAHPINSILCPGLATLTGHLSPRACAKQMRHALDNSGGVSYSSVSELLSAHRQLTNC